MLESRPHEPACALGAGLTRIAHDHLFCNSSADPGRWHFLGNTQVDRRTGSPSYGGESESAAQPTLLPRLSVAQVGGDWSLLVTVEGDAVLRSFVAPRKDAAIVVRILDGNGAIIGEGPVDAVANVEYPRDSDWLLSQGDLVGWGRSITLTENDLKAIAQAGRPRIDPGTCAVQVGLSRRLTMGPLTGDVRVDTLKRRQWSHPESLAVAAWTNAVRLRDVPVAPAYVPRRLEVVLEIESTRSGEVTIDRPFEVVLKVRCPKENDLVIRSPSLHDYRERRMAGLFMTDMGGRSVDLFESLPFSRFTGDEVPLRIPAGGVFVLKRTTTVVLDPEATPVELPGAVRLHAEIWVSLFGRMGEDSGGRSIMVARSDDLPVRVLPRTLESGIE